MIVALIVSFIVLANLPFFTTRLFIIRDVMRKSARHHLLEIVVYYLLAVLLLATRFENRYAGDMHAQDWEFYAATACFFLVLAVPGVVYRYQWTQVKK
ncbi:MAG: DUF2818 family protein [Mycoplasmataceae bacterium]|nr:DUF2818 family protein [Mycoplasmataceae bacterium]